MAIVFDQDFVPEFKPFEANDAVYLDEIIARLDKADAPNNAALARHLRNLAQRGVGPSGRIIRPHDVRLDRDLGITFTGRNNPENWALRAEKGRPVIIEPRHTTKPGVPQPMFDDGNDLIRRLLRYSDMDQSLLWWADNHPRTTAALGGITFDGRRAHMTSGSVRPGLNAVPQILDQVMRGKTSIDPLRADTVAYKDAVRPLGIMNLPTGGFPEEYRTFYQPEAIPTRAGFAAWTPAQNFNHEMGHLLDTTLAVGDPKTSHEDRIKRLAHRSRLSKAWAESGVPLRGNDPLVNDIMRAGYLGHPGHPYMYGYESADEMLDLWDELARDPRARTSVLDDLIGQYGRAHNMETWAQLQSIKATEGIPALTATTGKVPQDLYAPDHPMRSRRSQEVMGLMNEYQSDILNRFGDRGQIKARPMAASPVGMAAQIGVPVALGALGSRTDGPLRDSLMGAAAGAGIGGFLGVPGMAVGGFLGAVAPQLQRLSGSSST